MQDQMARAGADPGEGGVVATQRTVAVVDEDDVGLAIGAHGPLASQARTCRRQEGVRVPDVARPWAPARQKVGPAGP